MEENIDETIRQNAETMQKEKATRQEMMETLLKKEQEMRDQEKARMKQIDEYIKKMEKQIKEATSPSLSMVSAVVRNQGETEQRADPQPYRYSVLQVSEHHDKEWFDIIFQVHQKLESATDALKRARMKNGKGTNE